MSVDEGCIKNPDWPCCDHSKRRAEGCETEPVCVKLRDGDGPGRFRRLFKKSPDLRTQGEKSVDSLLKSNAVAAKHTSRKRRWRMRDMAINKGF